MFGEALESRTLLAGNVEATLVDGDLSLEGDSDDNSVEILVEGEDLVVRGLDGTTINGLTDDFVIEAGSTSFAGSVDAMLGAGADTFLVTGPLTIGGSIDSTDVSGAGQFALTDATIEGDVAVQSASAADVVSLLNATIDGDMTLRMGNGRNFVSLLDSSVSGKLDVRTGNRNDVVLLEATTVGSLCAQTGAWIDDVILRDVTVEGDFFAATGSERDFVLIEDSSVAGDTQVWMWQASDLFVTQGTVEFSGDLLIGGILGRNDTVELSDETTVGGETRILAFEHDQLSDLTGVNDRIDRRVAEAAEFQVLLNGVDLGDLTLTVDISGNSDTVESNNTTITKSDTFLIEGTTLPRATVDVTAEDGAIDLGNVLADADGNYSIVVDLLNGGTTIAVTATDVLDRMVSEEFNLHKAVGTVTRFETTQGTFDVELLDDDAPNTVANFLNYFDRYVDSIVHRSATNAMGDPFVIQGGGIVLDGMDNVDDIVKDAPIDSEFTGENSNLRGTIAMALSGGDANSATSEWFVNMSDDNAFLDGQQFTVFGEVVGDGMDVLDQIATLDRFDLEDILKDVEVLRDEVPLDGYTEDQIPLTGTVSIPGNSIVVTGTGTLFTTELEENDVIQIDGQQYRVIDIASDVEMTVDFSQPDPIVDATYSITREPTRDEYVLIDSISVIL